MDIGLYQVRVWRTKCCSLWLDPKKKVGNKMWKHLKIEMFERWEKHWGRWMDDGDAQRQYWQHKRPEIEHQSHFFVQTSWPRRMLGARNNLPLPPFLQKRCKKSRKSLKEQRLEIFSLLLPLTVSPNQPQKVTLRQEWKVKMSQKTYVKNKL